MKIISTNIARRTAALLLTAALAVPLTGAMHAMAQDAADPTTEVDGPNILANGGFEQGADPGDHLALAPGQSPFLAGWTIINGSVDSIGGYWKAEEGTRSIGLNYDGNGVLANASGIKQAFPTTVGQRYRVVFYQSTIRTTPTIVRFTIAGQTRDFTYQLGPNDTQPNIPWVKRGFVFVATAASTTIEFQALFTKGYWIALDNVQVRAIRPPAAGGTPTPGTGTGVTAGTVALQLAAPTIAAGGRQTVQGTAGANAAVALVVDYPDGTQLLAPLKAGADGRYTYAWTVPASVHGAVQVLADSAGKTTHGSFVVG